jgi:hypothetical protein
MSEITPIPLNQLSGAAQNRNSNTPQAATSAEPVHQHQEGTYGPPFTFDISWEAQSFLKSIESDAAGTPAKE